MVTWLERAERISPRGAQTLSKRGYPFEAPHVECGSGCHVWTVDNKKLIDWVCSLATVTLGHGHEYVTKAIRNELDCGGTFALPHVLEVEVGERLCAFMGYEQVRWATTGSEATEAAVRTARIATGRSLVLSHGYHSWFSTFTAARPTKPGVPHEYTLAIEEWTTLEHYESLLQRFDVAAVILEPAKFDKVELMEIVLAARAMGTLVIFDEVVSGFRYALRGVQEIYGIRPDLSVYGKAITNGTFPVSALLGPRHLMQHAWPASGTYSGHPVGLAAVDAVLDVYEEEPVIERIHGAGRALIDGFNALKFPISLGGHPARPMWRGDQDKINAFLCAVYREGVLMHPAGLNAMAAHTEEDITATLDACVRAARVLA